MTVQGGDVRIIKALLEGIDLDFRAEDIIVGSGGERAVVKGNRIRFIAESEYKGILPIKVSAIIKLENAEITAADQLFIKALSVQEPGIIEGILEIKDTIAEVLIKDTVLDVGELIIIAESGLHLTPDDFFDSILETPTVIANVRACVIIDGNSRIHSGGNIHLKASSDVETASIVNFKGIVGTGAFAISVVNSTAEALLRGNTILSADGKVVIAAENSTQVDTIADGSAFSEGAGGVPCVAISVVTADTRAGIYENASVERSSGIEIHANSRNHMNTAAQAAVDGSDETVEAIIEFILEEILADASDEVKEKLQNEICAVLDKIGEAVKKEGEGNNEKGSAIQAAGALAYGYVANTTEAAIASKNLVQSDGTIDVISKALTNTSVLASGITSGGKVGVGAGISILNGFHTHKAFIGDESKINAYELNIAALCEDYDPEDPEQVDRINDYIVKAYAGQSAGMAA